MGEQPKWYKYIFVLIITIGIFSLTFLLSSYFNNKKLSSLKSIQNTMSLDIMSSETQFSLLSELSCKDVDVQSILSQELNSLAEKIEFSEKNISTNREEIQSLKKYYILLQLKDYLLVSKISEQCNKKITSIIYIYTSADNCSECVKQGYVLSELRNKYPDLRVYSFDYNSNISAIKTLLSLFKIKDTFLPAMVVGDKSYSGFQSVESIESYLPKKFIDTHNNSLKGSKDINKQ